MVLPPPGPLPPANPPGELPPPDIAVDDMLRLLETALHASRTQWVFLRELRVGTAFDSHEAQRLDAFALNALPHLGMKRVCYEIKTSRADLLCELRRPLKRRIGLRYSNEFYFVTPSGLLALPELPIECGLIEVGAVSTDATRKLLSSHPGFCFIEPETSFYLRIAVPAPWRDTPGPTWKFVASMLRNQARQYEERQAPPRQQRLPLA